MQSSGPRRPQLPRPATAARLAVVASGLLLLTLGPAIAQGPEAPGPGPPAEAAEDAAVEAGAGTKGDVTNGSSGPPGKGGAEPVEPLPLGFPIAPPQDPFHGPGRLAIGPPERLRCAIIADPGAERRCQARASRGDGG